MREGTAFARTGSDIVKDQHDGSPSYHDMRTNGRPHVIRSRPIDCRPQPKSLRFGTNIRFDDGAQLRGNFGERAEPFPEPESRLLQQHAKLPWDQTYRFVQSASKGRMTDQHELWKLVLEGLEQRHGANGDALFDRLVAASRWAVCRAHHVANSITSYKAAYFRTHYREDFERTRQQLMSVEQGV